MALAEQSRGGFGGDKELVLPPRFRLLARLALGRNHAVHAEILDDLTIVVVAVSDHTCGQGEPRGLGVAKWRRNLLDHVLLADGVDCAMRFGELSLQKRDHFLFCFHVFRTIFLGTCLMLLSKNRRSIRLQSITNMLELLAQGSYRIGSLKVPGNIGSGRRKLILVLRNCFSSSHD